MLDLELRLNTEEEEKKLLQERLSEQQVKSPRLSVAIPQSDTGQMSGQICILTGVGLKKSIAVDQY